MARSTGSPLTVCALVWTSRCASLARGPVPLDAVLMRLGLAATGGGVAPEIRMRHLRRRWQ